MKKILATTDFSINSWKAISYAVELAQRTGAEVVILNAYTLPYSNQTVLLSMKEILKESAEQGLKDVLQKIHNELKPEGIQVSTKAVHGDLLVTIDLMAESEGVDLVIMGTKGATGLKAALIGSNAANVIRNVECPVIAVPESYIAAPIKHITICADFTTGLEEKIDFKALTEISKVYKSKIQLIHIIDPFEDNQTQKIPTNTNFQEFFPDSEISASVNYNEDVEEGIREFINDNPTDLLVMVRRNYNFLESLFHRSLTRQLAMHTEIPLLVVQEKS
jgi:nucleotide-binding universal stress UspA family protein